MGSVTIVANRDIKQQSVRVTVKHHAPADARLTHRWHQDKISIQSKGKKFSLNLCRVP